MQPWFGKSLKSFTIRAYKLDLSKSMADNLLNVLTFETNLNLIWKYFAGI